MACCSEFQNECLKVVTIGYLKTFIGNLIQDSSNGSTKLISYSDNTYCPTYSELTGGTFIQTWSQGSTPQSDRDGVAVGGSYSNNQLVRQQDLQVKYTRFNTLSIGRNGSGNISECGGNESLTYTYNYDRHTKSMNSSSCATSDTLTNTESACGELTYYTTYGSVASCASYSIGKNGSVSAPSRSDSIYANVSFRGASHNSNTITIGQNALTGSYSTYVSSYTVPTGCSARATTSTSFGCEGGSYAAAGTGYFDTYYRYSWTDSCGTNYPSLTSDTKVGSSSTSLGSKSGSFSSISCPATTCSDSDTIPFSYGNYSDSVSFYQSGTNSCGCSKPTEWESYDCSQHQGETITVNGTAYTNCTQDTQGNCNCTPVSTSTTVHCGGPTPGGDCSCSGFGFSSSANWFSEGGTNTIGSGPTACTVTCSNGPDWVSCGRDDTGVVLTASKNTGSERSGSIDVYVDGTHCKNVSLSQAGTGGSECTTGYSWDKTDAEACVGHSGETVTVNGVYTYLDNGECKTSATTKSVTCPCEMEEIDVYAEIRYGFNRPQGTGSADLNLSYRVYCDVPLINTSGSLSPGSDGRYNTDSYSGKYRRCKGSTSLPTLQIVQIVCNGQDWGNSSVAFSDDPNNPGYTYFDVMDFCCGTIKFCYGC